MQVKKRFFIFWYYRVGRHLPRGRSLFGKIGSRVRYLLCRNIFEYCGSNVTIEKGARFTGGADRIRIGDNSSIGLKAVIPNGTVIGENVMMAPNCFVHDVNHRFDRTDIPMIQQGSTSHIPIVIEDDVWIGRDVTIMRGRHIAKGSIIAANCVLTRDFPEYSIVGGNPSRLIRSRLENHPKPLSDLERDEFENECP